MKSLFYLGILETPTDRKHENVPLNRIVKHTGCYTGILDLMVLRGDLIK